MGLRRNSAAKTKPAKPRYFRDHRDWVLHLALELAQLSTAEMLHKKSEQKHCDLNRATDGDIREAREILKRSGIRTPDESAPAWHFADKPGSRVTEPAA